MYVPMFFSMVAVLMENSGVDPFTAIKCKKDAAAIAR